MLEKELQRFLHGFRLQKRIFIFFVLLGASVVFGLLFYGGLPDGWVRSWILVPALLFTMISALALVRAIKKINFYESVFKSSQIKSGIVTLVQSANIKEGEDLIADLELERERWEIHLYPPVFNVINMRGQSQSVDVLLDNEKKPTILVTRSGCFFANSSRLTLRK